MIGTKQSSPRRYCSNRNGHRVLIGLSEEETFEFETLDGSPTLDDAGQHMAWTAEGQPTTVRERRWLELYLKHDDAWRSWMAERRNATC